MPTALHTRQPHQTRLTADRGDNPAPSTEYMEWAHTHAVRTILAHRLQTASCVLLNSQNASSPRGIGSYLNASGSNLSYFDTGGEFARELEKEGSEAQIDFTINELRSLFGSDVDKYFVKAASTAWDSNPFTLGSYASAEPGSYHLRKTITEPIEERLFFAGEATAEEYASVSGAHRSGIRAAKEVIGSI